MKLEKFILILSIVFCTIPGQSQTLNISIETGRYQIDNHHMLIVSQIDSIANYNNLSQYQDMRITLGEDEYVFNSVPALLRFSSSYKVKKGTDNFTLYLTQLPLISIASSNNIVNEPKVAANFSYADDKMIFTSDCGIELRGGVSLYYPKKTFDLEFWTDQTGTTNRDVRFGDLRLDDDWVLDALYNEPLRIRSYLAHNLWPKIHQPYYLDARPKAKAGAEVIYAEVFLNGKYNGLYILSEQVDKKQLQIEDYDGTIRGELYKSISWGGACTFESLPSFSNRSRLWGGYKYKYPEVYETTDWSDLYNFTNFAMYSSNSDFKDDIWNRFNKENCMDYYIYLNLIRAGDNSGKNIYMAKPDLEYTYFYSPWDLDACFGTMWTGANDSRTDNILTNGLFKRAINLNAGNFKTEMGNRWHALRENTLSNTTLENSFISTYNSLVYNNVYKRESVVYPNYDFSVSSFNYTLNWLRDRLTFLDTYFVKTEVSSRNIETLSQKAIIYPNPARDYIQIKLENTILDHSFAILDLRGKIVLQGTFDVNEQIDLSGISSGIYFIQLDQSTHKLIVE